MTTIRTALLTAPLLALALAGPAMAATTATAQPIMNDPPPAPKKILILGGTGLLGPHIVERARERGHEVTLFNRGRSSPGLFPEVERIEGDRYSDLSGLEKAVKDGRRWDAVIDTFTYVPKTVTDAMDILKPAMDHFVVISTISVYASNDEPNADESAPLATVPDEVAAQITTHEQVGQHYGAMKARVEKAAEENFPGKVTIIRPGLIVGPRDTTGRYAYWPIRASEGGRMVAPGDGSDPIQIVDARDLADFIVTCVEERHLGVYNAVNPAGSLTMREVVDSACRVAGGTTTPVWIPFEFLAEQGVAPWQQMPAWVPPTLPGYAGFGRVNTDRAVKAGLKSRPIDEINRAILEYFTTRSGEIREERGEEFAAQWRQRMRGGLPKEKEAEVLAAWDSRNAATP
ncbi:MAG: NAD-dependent epimerase/dehydratase family protein [Phycisphaeraceae bacterium]|nr:NAD-dependent epimerase/dehydratase family protein [Phycisphaeraceae bacterium]